MFHPLAFTKTFAMVGVALLAVTFVPAIIPILIKGRLRSEDDNWIVRSFIHIYKPCSLLMNVPAAASGSWRPCSSWPVDLGRVRPRRGASGLRRPDAPPGRGRSLLPPLVGQTIALVLLVGIAVWAWNLPKLGREFMPPLDEGSILDMPVTVPRVSMAQAGDDIRVRDRVMRGFPEVDQVVGKAGRADTPTDPSGIDMVETIVDAAPQGVVAQAQAAL